MSLHVQALTVALQRGDFTIGALSGIQLAIIAVVPVGAGLTILTLLRRAASSGLRAVGATSQH